MTIKAELIKTVQKIAEKGKGILAADESSSTIKKRFDYINLASTEENRRAYRDLLLTTPGIGNYISGVIFYEETLYQKIADVKPSAAAVRANAELLARYAAICQTQGIVPIVEPEVLINGNHTLARCETVTEDVLNKVFSR